MLNVYLIYTKTYNYYNLITLQINIDNKNTKCYDFIGVKIIKMKKIGGESMYILNNKFMEQLNIKAGLSDRPSTYEGIYWLSPLLSKCNVRLNKKRS